MRNRVHRRSVRARALLLGALLVLAACGTRVTDGSASLAAATSASGSDPGSATQGEPLGTPSGQAADDTSVVSQVGSGEEPSAPTGPAQAGSSEDAGPGAASAGFDVAGGNQQGVSDTEIRVGYTGPLSGVLAFIGEESAGAIDSYFQTVNAAGGINGRRLKLISYDDRFDNSQALANVRRLWEQDKVHAIFLSTGIGVLDYVTSNKIPTFVFGITPESFASKYATTFPLVGSALTWTHQTIVGLKERGVFQPGMRVAILLDTQIFDVGPYLAYIKQAWEDAGATVVSSDPFNFTDGDCTSLVVKMKQMGIDYWDFQGLGWVLCVAAAGRQQYAPPVGWGGWPTSVAGLTTQAGPGVDGVWSVNVGDQPTGAPREKTAAIDAYVASIKRYHPNIGSFGHLESPATIGYWTGAKVLVEGVRMQQHPTTEGTLKAITSLENFDPGIAPPIQSLAPNCKTGSDMGWIGQWRWDEGARVATRVPATGYKSTPDKDRYGGKCFLTMISDKIVGG